MMLRFGSVPSLVPTFLVAGALVFYSGSAVEEHVVIGAFTNISPRVTFTNISPRVTFTKVVNDG